MWWSRMFQDWGPAVEHGPVVALRAGQHLGVLPRGELREGAVPDGRPRGPPPQFGEQGDDLRFTALGQIAGGQRVGLRLLVERLEAAVRLQGVPHPVGVVLAQVGEHGVQRLPQAVDVESEEAHAPFGRQLLVVPAQPPGERGDLGVGPHPRGPAVEARQHLAGVLGCARRAHHGAVHGLAVRPVALHGDEGEAFSPR